MKPQQLELFEPLPLVLRGTHNQSLIELVDWALSHGTGRLTRNERGFLYEILTRQSAVSMDDAANSPPVSTHWKATGEPDMSEKENVVKASFSKEEWNPFDPETLRAMGSGSISTKKELLAVAVRRPKKDEFFRTHPDKDMHIVTKLYFTSDREAYLVHPSLTEISKAVLVCIYLCSSRPGDPFFWPVRLPGGDGKDNEYWRTARDAATKARDLWVRIETNQKAGHYDLVKAEGDLPPPQWPDLSLPEMLELAFKGNNIKDRDHHVIQQLLGK